MFVLNMLLATYLPCFAHRREVGGQRRGHALRSPSDSLSLGPARARQQKAMPVGLLRKLRKPPVMFFATGSVIHSATPRRKQNCFYACVPRVHTHQATTADRGASLASHKNEFCSLRPPGARPALSALRLISPCCARPPLLGVSALVGPATARAARHVAGPSWSPHSRR